MRSLLFAMLPLTFATASVAQEASPQRVAVSMVVRQEGAVIAEPRLEMPSGQTGTVEIDDGRGGTLRITLVPTLADDGVVSVAFDAERQSTDGDVQNRVRMTSTVAIRPGETALVNGEGSAPSSMKLSIALTAETVQG